MAINKFLIMIFNPLKWRKKKTQLIIMSVVFISRRRQSRHKQ